MQNNQATYNQISYLRSLYEKGIGYCNTYWYIAKLKKQGFTKDEASKEIKRLNNISFKFGPTAMKPRNWEAIKPDSETLKRFMEEWEKNAKLVVDDGE